MGSVEQAFRHIRSLKEGSRVFASVALASALTGGLLACMFPPLVVGVGVGGVIWLLWLLWCWPSAAIVTLATSVSMPGLVLAGGVSITAERVAMPVVAVVLVLSLLARETSRLRLGYEHLGLGLFIGLNALGGLLNAPDVAGSLKLTVLVGIASLPFWLLPNIARDRRGVVLAFWAFIIVSLLEAIMGLGTTVAHRLTELGLGMQMDPLTGAASPKGTQFESNTFGSQMAAALVAVVGWSAASRRHIKRPWLIGVCIVCIAAALGLSLSRGAWLGALAGLFVLALALGGRRATAISVIGLAVFLLLGILLIVADPNDFRGSPMLYRMLLVGDLLQGKLDPTTSERMYLYGLALQGWMEHPIIGWGAGAFGQLHMYRSVNLPAWLSNLEIHALFDSGVVGLLGLMLAILGTIFALILAIRRSTKNAGADKGILVGLLGASVVLFVAFQATEATWLGYGWYVYGTAWAASLLGLGRAGSNVP